MTNYVVKTLSLDLETAKQNLEVAQEMLQEKTDELSNAAQKSLEVQKQQADKYYQLKKETQVDRYKQMAAKAASKGDTQTAMDASRVVGKIVTGNMETSDMVSYKVQSETAEKQLENFSNHLKEYHNDVEALQNEIDGLEQALTFARSLQVSEDTEE